jgi:hypothetical protein
VHQGRRRWRVWQTNSSTGPPTVFLPINDQHAGEQLDFVTEQLERNGARQKGRIHENTSPERHLIGHRSWLAEQQSDRTIGGGKGLFGKPDLDVGDGQRGLINHDRRDVAAAGCESHPPGSVAGAAMLDDLVENDVTRQRQQER